MLVQQCFTGDFSALTSLVLVSVVGILVNYGLIYVQASCASFVSGEVRGLPKLYTDGSAHEFVEPAVS